MNEQMQPIHPAYAALLSGQRPEPCQPFVEVSTKVLARLLDVVEFGDQLERVEKDNLLASMKELLALEQPELWAIHSVGPGELHPMISKEAAEQQAAELTEAFKEHVGTLGLRFDVIRSPFTPLEHFEILAEEVTEHRDNLLGHCNALEKKLAETSAPAVAMPQEISRDLLGKIVDEVFDGAIEDPRVIEEVYRVIAREQHALPAECDASFAERYSSDPADPAVAHDLTVWREAWAAARPFASQQVTTADLASVRCQCCQADHAADSYDAGFIAGSGMCQVCDAAMPQKDLPIREVEIPTIVATFDGLYLVPTQPLKCGDHLMTVAQHRRILNALINTPHTDEWFDAVRLEAAHQIQRWGSAHDAGKQPADWFWLLGYLGQKAMAAQMIGDEQKAKHHTISSGAMLLNWFRAMVGDTNAMRPGIAPAQQEQQP